MAESHSVTAAERAARTLLSEHADVPREAVAMVVTEPMEADISAGIGAAHGEVPPDRVTYRDGRCSRIRETPSG